MDYVVGMGAPLGQEKFKIFCDEFGKFYKAEKATAANHSQMTTPTTDYFRALSDDGSTLSREEIIAKINHPEFKRDSGAVSEA